MTNALILHANGTNRDHDVAKALTLAGATPEIVHLNQLRNGDRKLGDYQMLVVPGGFSYGDSLGAGRLIALDLQTYFADEVQAFVESGKPVIGICNGFQALVKAGVLPDTTLKVNTRATLTFNERQHFECRWVTLKAASDNCAWIKQGDDLIFCPIAHGEGRFLLSDPADLAALQANQQVALTYTHADGTVANGEYPINPNGSIGDIAGICNKAGNVLGLMPHPENHILPFQHPRWTRGEQGQSGLKLFENGVRYAESL